MGGNQFVARAVKAAEPRVDQIYLGSLSQEIVRRSHQFQMKRTVEGNGHAHSTL